MHLHDTVYMLHLSNFISKKTDKKLHEPLISPKRHKVGIKKFQENLLNLYTFQKWSYLKIHKNLIWPHFSSFGHILCLDLGTEQDSLDSLFDF